MIAGKDAPTFGEAKNSWLTGTAAWNYYAIVQWILGIRTSLDGLEIAPVIPKELAGLHRHSHLSRSGLQDLHRAQGREFGGVYWMLDFEGQPIDTKKRIYGQAFTVYALAEYFHASGDAESTGQGLAPGGEDRVRQPRCQCTAVTSRPMSATGRWPRTSA
jgi:hypothetical protein